MAIFNSYVKLPEGINPRESLLMFNDVYPLPLARISNGGYAVTGLPIWYVCFWGLGVRTSEKAEKRRANPSLIYQTRPNTMRAENNSRAVQSWKRMKQGHVSNMRGP